jgi:hypothetical protein
MPVVKCPRVPEYACTARTAEGLCTRDFVILDGPDAQCSYLREQNVKRAEISIREIRDKERQGKKITDSWNYGVEDEASERTD